MDVSRLVGSEKKAMLKVLGELISKDTTNPPGNEWRAAEVVKGFFRREKIPFKVFENEKGRTNVIGYVGKGKPRLIIACHLDVVPPGEGWKTDPFRMVVKGGKAYGRGATDNKGPMASMLIAGKILKKFERRLKGQVILACIADEERGSSNGMYYLIRQKKLEGEYAIVPDISNGMRKISLAEKGLLHLKVTSLGKQAHGSTPQDGINAVWNMIDFLNMLRKYRMKVKKSGLFTNPTMNLGAIEGGHAPNIVPGECQVLLDFRYLPSQRVEDIIRDVKKMLAAARAKNRKARFRLEVRDRQDPFEIEKENILVRKIQEHTSKVTGKRPVVFGMPGTTVVKPLVMNNTFAVGFSIGDNVAHISNEYILVKQMEDFAKVLCLVCLDMLG